MHELRDDMSYRAIVDELIEVPRAAEPVTQRRSNVLPRPYLKLLFPKVRSANDITAREFKRYASIGRER